MRSYVGNGINRFVKRVLTGQVEAEPQPQLYERALALFEKHYAAVLSRESRPYPGVMEGLESLRRAGFRLACVTNKADSFTRPLLRDTGLLDYFDLVLSGDSLPRKKPDPLPLLHACEHFGVKPDEMLLIGDSANDTRAARAAGCHVFCVSYGYNNIEDLRELGADAVVSSIVEAAEMIRLQR